MIPGFVWAMLMGVSVGTTALAAVLITLRGWHARAGVVPIPDPMW